MTALAALLAVAGTTIAVVVIIIATPERDDTAGPAIVDAKSSTGNAAGCRSFDQAMRRLDEILRTGAIPHPEISDLIATARGQVAAAAERTFGQTQQAMDRVVTRLQLWSDHEAAHRPGGNLDDNAEVTGLRAANAVVVTRCSEAGVGLQSRLKG